MAELLHSAIPPPPVIEDDGAYPDYDFDYDYGDDEYPDYGDMLRELLRDAYNVWGSQCFQEMHTPSCNCIPGSIPETLTNCGNGVVKEKIKSVLREFKYWLVASVILIQFWEPIVVMGRCCLTTSDQPFGLSRIHKGLCSYRRHSIRYTINVDGEKSDEELGLPGRVFQHKQPESTPDVRYYSKKEYPQRDFAVRCGVRSSFALPVFEPSGQSCVGVLELVGTSETVITKIFTACTVIKEVGLRYSNVLRHLHLGGDKDAVSELSKVLKVVCETHKLRIGQAWAPYLRSCGVDNGDNIGKSCNEEDIILTSNVFFSCVMGSMEWEFQNVCRLNHFRKGQGHVGKALLSHKPCFIRDITQLSIIEYPLAHHARWCELTGCFAICLLNTSTGNIDYVLELFLPPSNTENGDPQTLLDSLVATMKPHLQSFTVASGELGDELSVEVIKTSANELDSLKICQTFNSYPRPEALQTEREAVEADSSHQQSAVAMEADSSAVAVEVDSSQQQSTVAVEADSSQHHSTVAVEADSSHQQSVVGAEQSNTAVTRLDQTGKTKTSNRARKYSISYEDIQHQQHLGTTLDDAADSLGVGRSTLKRICREYGLEDWRASRKRKKVNRPPSNLKHITDSVQGGNERNPKSSRGDPSCSKPPPKQTLPSVTPMQDASTVTVKAKYKDVTIKFQLSFSSGMAELLENITERLQLLKDRAFSIKYQDDEDDWILIGCDKDLQECMSSSRSLPVRTPIRMLIDQPLNNEAL